MFGLSIMLWLVTPAQGDDPIDGSPGPNILFILLDDFGVNDLGSSNGSPGLTPNLEKLAAEGVSFTRNYVDSTCQATRAGILTGRYPASLGFRPSGPGINPEITTLPEALREAGYTTHHIGKWHLGFVSKLAWPLQQGFDSFYGFLNQFVLRGPHSDGDFRLARPTYFDPWLQSDNEPPEQQQGHLSDLLLRRALTLIQSKKDQSKPWFINYWMYLPHTPLQPAERFAEQQIAEDQGRYRAMLQQADSNIGRVLETLEQHGLSESTLVIVASDNGGTEKQLPSNAPFRGQKASFGEGGIRTPLIIRGPGFGPPGSTSERVASYLDYLPTLLAAAGVEPPAGLPGKSFLEPMSDGAAADFLFWESNNSKTAAWSVLDGINDLRLHKFFIGHPELYDLAEDPSATRDIMAAKPVPAERLHRQFVAWRQSQRRVAVDIERQSAGTGARISGSSFEKAPGFGGFSFIMGVQPHDPDESEFEQVLVDHPGFWRLWHERDRAVIELMGMRAELPPFETGRCSQLIITSHHAHNFYKRDSSWALMEVYVDGRMVASEQQLRPALPPANYSTDIYIGQDHVGEHPFIGLLGTPVLLNERLQGRDSADPWLVNGLADAPRSDCKMEPTTQS